MKYLIVALIVMLSTAACSNTSSRSKTIKSNTIGMGVRG